MAAPRTPWTHADADRLKELHAEGWSLHAIAQEMGRSKSVIYRGAKALDLSWDRSRSKAATDALVADARKRRAQFLSDVLDVAEDDVAHRKAFDQTGQWKTLIRGQFGEETRILDYIPVKDRREFADTLNRHTHSIEKLEAMDAGRAPDAVKNLLRGLAGRLGITDADPNGSATGG